MSCVFCEIGGGRGEASVVFEERDLLAFMDIRPLRPGHVLVVPRVHAGAAAGLPGGLAGRLFEAALRVGAALRETELSAAGLPCDDFHVVLNDGPAAFQTVAHVHLHVVPRRRGDVARFVGALAGRPAAFLLPPAQRDLLDRQAAAIGRHLGASRGAGVAAESVP